MTFLVPFLRNEYGQNTHDEIEVEYRLACSGSIYNGSVICSDWTKSQAARLFATDRFRLIALYDRQDPYPQELSLTFKCRFIEVNWQMGESPSTTTFAPHSEIASDLAAALTLFARRLITVSGMVRETHNCSSSNPVDYPAPIQGKNGPAWPLKASTIISKPKADLSGVDIELIQHAPEDAGLDQHALERFLKWIGDQPESLASPYLLALRLYQQALRLIHEEVTVSYQLLISAIETIATAAISPPAIDEILEKKKRLVSYLGEQGLDKEQVRKAVEADTKGASWNSHRFMKFIQGNIQQNVWSWPDSLYPGNLYLEDFMPRRGELRKMLANVYGLRSAATHSGKPFPDYVSIGLSPFISDKAMMQLGPIWPKCDKPKASSYVPPILWFERLVQSALYGLTLQPISNNANGSQ